MAKEGSTIGGLMDCFGTAVSMSLQYGVPLEVYVNKFSHTRFEPMGYTKNPDIRIAKSIVDYIFRWLGITFLPGYREANKAIGEPPHAVPGEPTQKEFLPAATMAGGPSAAQGSVKPNGSANGASNGSSVANGNGNGHTNGNGHGGNGNGHGPVARAAGNGASLAMSPKQAAKRNGGTAVLAAPRSTSAWRRPCWPRASPRPPPVASSSPRSKPTPPPATTAARSPSATATATSATTAAAAWGARRGARFARMMASIRKRDRKSCTSCMPTKAVTVECRPTAPHHGCFVCPA